jgi:hypothetical protein
MVGLPDHFSGLSASVAVRASETGLSQVGVSVGIVRSDAGE